MSRLDFYGKKYESGQPAELQMHQPHLQQTNQKKIKYYSNHEYEETIRKKLILDYPSNLEAQNPNLLLASDKERGQSTKYSTFQQQSNNKRLLQRLDASLKSYQPQFRNKKEIKSINFTQFDLQNELKKQEPTSAYLPQPMKWDEKITSKLQKAKVIEESERLVEEFLPRHRIQKVNQQITALYKQNRNVNLQYRRDKFMQIFTGKSQFSKRSYQAQTQDP